jgi:hypothetical protein
MCPRRCLGHCQSAICRHASRSTHRPTAVIWPVCSRIGTAPSKPRQPERIAIAGDHCQPAKRFNHSRQQQQRVIPAARLAEHNAVLAVIPPTSGRPRLAEPVVVANRHKCLSALSAAIMLPHGVSEMDEPVREKLTSDRVARVADLGELQRSAVKPEGVLAGALTRFWRASRYGGLRERDRSA